MTDIDLAGELGLAIRLVGAAVLGALVGLEREIHQHPAGMRTHLLVALGAAGFTVLSIGAFAATGSNPGSDPGRVAAQVVTGVGFLGAGAILKEGATIRGLTTAASLWAVAAIGMATGAGAWWIAVALTAIVVLSLWPLRLVTERLVSADRPRVQLRLATTRAERIGAVLGVVDEHDATVARLATERATGGDLVVEMEVRAPSPGATATIVAAVDRLDGIDLVESTMAGE